MSNSSPSSNGWSRVKLSKIIRELPSGVSVNSEDRPAKAGEAGVLKVSSVSNGRFFPSENKVITGIEVSRARMPVYSGDLLLSRSNTSDLVGASGMACNDFPNLFLPDKLWKVVLEDPSRDCSEWLLQLLNSSSMRKSLKNIATGTSGSMKNISKPSFMSIRVLRPSLPEQQRIATVLSTWDRAIEITEKLVAATQNRRHALVHRLFANSVPDHRMGKPHAGWRRVCIGDLVLKRVEKSSDLSSFPLYSFTIEQGVTEKTDRYERSFLLKDRDNNEYAIVHCGDFVVNPMNIRFGAVGRSRIPSPVAVSAYYDVFHVCNSDCDATYLEYLLKSPLLMHTYETVSTGSLIEKRRVHFSEFQKIRIMIPSLLEQQKVASVLSQQDREIRLFTDKVECLKQQKKGLMQQLLTGKVRVNLDSKLTKR